MNKLKTDNVGGVSFEWDDWRWEQEAVREAFFGLVSAWGTDPDDSFIISGCGATLNGLNYDIDAGFISLNGEIFKVNAHSVVAALGVGAVHFWEQIVTYDPTGLEATKNAGTVDTYEIRTAVVQNATAPIPSFMPMVAETINQKIFNSTANFNVFQTVLLNGSSDIVQNDDYSGNGNNIALTQAPLVGSYIKYNIQGKVVNVTFHLEQFQTTANPTGGGSAARTIVMLNLPFTFVSAIDQFFVAHSLSQDTDSVQGHTIATLRDNRIIFKMTQPQGAPIEFNEVAEMATPPSKNYNTKSQITPARTWSISGSFTAELL